MNPSESLHRLSLEAQCILLGLVLTLLGVAGAAPPPATSLFVVATVACAASTPEAHRSVDHSPIRVEGQTDLAAMAAPLRTNEVVVTVEHRELSTGPHRMGPRLW